MGKREHLADFPLSGLGFKGFILTVGGRGKQREVVVVGEWRFGAVVVKRDELQ